MIALRFVYNMVIRLLSTDRVIIGPMWIDGANVKVLVWKCPREGKRRESVSIASP